MAAVTWTARIFRKVEDAARLALGSGFRHRGVTVQHPGVLLDQQRASGVVDKVADVMLKRAHSRRSVADLLARVDVRVLPARGRHRAQVDVDARWSGGLRDRGRILMRRSDDWPNRLGRALLALILMELEPKTRPEEVALHVTEELDG